MQTKLFDKNGKESGTVELGEKIFNRKVNKTLLWEAVNAIRDNMRNGNASTKTKAEVRGGGKKPYRQKGIGWARHGSTRSPLWKGGGVAFGPKPRDYSTPIPRKKRIGALLASLSAKAQENKVLVIEELVLEAPKTKNFVQIMKDINIEKARTLVAVDEVNKNTLLASRNVPNIYLKRANDINCYDVLLAEYLLITRKGLEKLEQRCVPKK
ncbi:MAG: 50S ribosomal protein L4 [candidate division WOR-3 bacterium]|nr:MAG: 50S ribosomal protein L4 [candidate division WOR-3 bacterium]